MARPINRLVGTMSWDPVGESMLSVLEKLALQNWFSKREMARDFGVAGANTFEASSRRDPCARKSLDVGRITELCGWPDDALDASFPTFYALSSSPPIVSDWRFYDVASSLRLCPECAAHGVHLVLHQFLECLLCPIHRCRLLDACPGCSLPLRPYAYPPDCSESSLRCSGCEWRAWDKVPAVDDELQGIKRKLLEEYVRWRRKLDDHRFVASSAVLIDAPRRWSDAPLLNALVPGPDWVEACLRGASRIRIETRPIPLRKSDVLTSLSTAGDRAEGAPWSREVRSRLEEIYLQRGKRRADRALALYTKFDRDFRAPRSMHSVRETRFGIDVQLTEASSAAAAALELWVKSVWPLVGLARPERGECGEAVRIASSRSLWYEWREGPARLHATSGALADHGKLRPLIGRIEDLWTEELLMGFYLATIGRIVSLPNVPIVREDLLELACDAGSLPLSVLLRGENGLELGIATRTSSYSDFVDLLGSASRDPGFDHGRGADEATLRNELIRDLVALRPDEQSRATKCLMRASEERQRAGRSTDEAVGMEFNEPSWRTRSRPYRGGARASAPRWLADASAPSHHARATSAPRPPSWILNGMSEGWVSDAAGPESSTSPPDLSDPTPRPDGTACEGERPAYLRALAEHPQVAMARRDESSWYVRCRDRLWVLWPSQNCWVGTDGEGDTSGARYRGSPADFKLACVDRPAGIPVNHFRVWDAIDRNKLMEYVDANRTVDEASYALGRSTWSVVSKAGSLNGLNFDPLKGDPHLGAYSFAHLMSMGSNA